MQGESSKLLACIFKKNTSNMKNKGTLRDYARLKGTKDITIKCGEWTYIES